MLWTTTIPFVTANCGWYKGTGCYRNTLPDNTLKQGGGELLPRVDAHDGPGGADKDSSTVDALVIWNRALKEYSRLELSFPARDRLVAISGVTENLAKHMIDSQYIAGLWQSDFVRQLLWRRVSSGTVVDLTELSGPPSWSWASISGAVEPEFPSSHDDKEKKQVLIEVLEAKAKLVDESCPFGAVKGRSLCIRAHLLDSDTMEVGEDPSTGTG